MSALRRASVARHRGIHASPTPAFAYPTARGFALAMVLVMAVALSLLALSAMHAATIEERIAGAARDRAVAQHAAEAALADARRDILALRWDDTACPSGEPGCRAAGQRPIAEARGGPGAQIGDADCAGAQCALAFAAANAPWRRFLADGCDASASVQRGTFTGAAPVADVAQQPCYLFEIAAVDIAPGEQRYLFRVTARATGVSPGTVAFLQQTFVEASP